MWRKRKWGRRKSRPWLYTLFFLVPMLFFLLLTHHQSPFVTVRLRFHHRWLFLPLKRYVATVLVAEMPLSFKRQALIAQTIAIRSYTLYQLKHQGYLVANPAINQGYVPKSTWPKLWGSRYQQNLKRLQSVMQQSKGLYLSYQGQAILGAYGAAAGKSTQSSREAFGISLPYLRRLMDPWDQSSPLFCQKKSLSLGTVAQRLGVSLVTLKGSQLYLRYNAAGRLQRLQLGQKHWTGTELMGLFHWTSTAVKLQRGSLTWHFFIYGAGNGVGLDQWGAEAMARFGKTAQQILSFYYPGTKLHHLS